jgi:tRNA A37 N6-isopentenylltransferase MiaA
MRAFTLWLSTGKKPSLLKPQFVMPYLTVVLVIVLPSRELLAERINLRAHQMIYQDDWIGEIRSLLGTSWESFVRAKKLVGYPELADWVLHGSHQNDLSAVIKTVCIKTRQYAKRQEVFLKKFAKDLANDAQSAGVNLTVLFTQDGSVQSVNKILATIKNLK